MQTLEAIARTAGLPVGISDDLTEQASDETDVDFRARIERFLKWWENESPEFTIACSHGDWLPSALELATGARAEFKKGAWAQLRLIEGRPVLSCLMQKLRKL